MKKLRKSKKMFSSILGFVATVRYSFGCCFLITSPNMLLVVKSGHLIFLVSLFLTLGFQSCSNSSGVKSIETPLFIYHSFERADSIKVRDLFIDVWNWSVKDDKMIILSKQNRDYFLYVLSLPEFELIYKYGTYGRGPNEFVAVNWLNALSDGQIGLYDIPQKKMYMYDLMTDTLILSKTFEFREWIENQAPPYTFIQQIEESLFVLKADMKEHTEVEMVNIETGEVLQVFRPLLKRNRKTTTFAPYLFNISASNDVIVFAYNFVNRLELYNIRDKKVTPFLIIGSNKDQADKKIEDYVDYYTDVHCDNKYIYALSQCGFSSQNGNVKNSVIEIYTLDGVPFKEITIDRHIEFFTIDHKRNVIFGYDPNVDFDYVYVYNLCID